MTGLDICDISGIAAVYQEGCCFLLPFLHTVLIYTECVNIKLNESTLTSHSFNKLQPIFISQLLFLHQCQWQECNSYSYSHIFKHMELFKLRDFFNSNSCFKNLCLHCLHWQLNVFNSVIIYSPTIIYKVSLFCCTQMFAERSEALLLPQQEKYCGSATELFCFHTLKIQMFNTTKNLIQVWISLIESSHRT